MQGTSECQYAAHVGLSRGAIRKAKTAERLVLYPDSSINAAASDARRVDPVRPECANECHSAPMSMRGPPWQARPSAPRPPGGHVRSHPCFIYEHKPLGVDPALMASLGGRRQAMSGRSTLAARTVFF